MMSKAAPHLFLNICCSITLGVDGVYMEVITQ